MKILTLEIGLVALGGILLCLSPWTGQFSYEFSFFLSLFVFFVVTISAIFRLKKKTLSLEQKWQWVGSYALVLIAPLVTVLVASFKYGMCDFTSGLLWYLLLPAITLFYAVACVIWACTYKYSDWKLWLIAFLPTIVFSLITLNDLYVDPMLSFYHPVLGYFPGPFYDEWIPKFNALYTYRFWVLGISIWLLYKNSLPIQKWQTCAILFLPFLFRGGFGWHYTHAQVQKHLSSEVHTKYVSVYFKNQDITNMRRFAKSLDFYVEKISERLELPLPNEKFRVYVYNTSFDKKKWTGTASTLIGNPMQKTLQLLPTEDYDTILIHELTHLVAAPMGMPLLKISPKAGLLEGLATSFQPSYIKLNTHEWAKIMLDLGKLPDIAKVLSPISFWKENPTKVYLATGSFSAWLIDHYDLQKYKRVYRGESFENVYGKHASVLMQEWEMDLKKVETPEKYTPLVDYFLSQKPFFQKRCVHEIADLETAFDNCHNSECVKYLDRACKLDPTDADMRLKRARYIFQKDIHSQMDTTLIPLPSAENSDLQNNRIQLFNDDLHHIQDPSHTYSETDYKFPSFEMQNSILTRMYLSKHSTEVLQAMLLGNYVPDVSLTWPKDEYYDDAMFYFAKSTLRAKQPQDAMDFLKRVNLENKDAEFLLPYWTTYSQVAEDLNQFTEASKTHEKIIELSHTQGMIDFSNLQIKRLKYLMLN